MSEPPVAITAGSVVNTDTSVPGTVANTSPAQAMKPAPRASAVQPAWPADVGSPRPSAWPTRTAPAVANPSGIMNVTLAISSTTWCAARSTGSSIPARTVATANTPTSSVTWTAAGSPSTTSRPIHARLRPIGTRISPVRCRRSWTRAKPISTAAM